MHVTGSGRGEVQLAVRQPHRIHISDGAGSYHVRVGLQHEASLFPPLLSVVVLKHITQTLKDKL